MCFILILSFCGSGYEKCILVVHDWGGAVGFNLVKEYPEMVEKFVVLNIGHPNAFREMLQKTYKQFLKSWYYRTGCLFLCIQAMFLSHCILLGNELENLTDQNEY